MGRDGRAATLDDVLDRIRERRGVDFRSYRRATVERRVHGRMQQVNAESYESYLGLLEASGSEVDDLLSRITIKVSAFFRDPDVFSLIEGIVVPELTEGARDSPVRVWSAGCGHGEEAYSLAMLFAEADPLCARVPPEIRGTDIDGRALALARDGRFPEEATSSLGSDRISTHFRRDDVARKASYLLTDRVRSMVEFTHHDLTTALEPPGGGSFDLVCCRNVVIYFSGELRERAQSLLCRSVAPGGYLCLGPAEWLHAPFVPGFDVVSRKARLFRRRPSAGET